MCFSRLVAVVAIATVVVVTLTGCAHRRGPVLSLRSSQQNKWFASIDGRTAFVPPEDVVDVETIATAAKIRGINSMGIASELSVAQFTVVGETPVPGAPLLRHIDLHFNAAMEKFVKGESYTFRFSSEGEFVTVGSPSPRPALGGAAGTGD